MTIQIPSKLSPEAATHRLVIRPILNPKFNEHRRECIIIHPSCIPRECPVGPHVDISAPEIPIKFISREKPISCRIDLDDEHVVVIDDNEVTVIHPHSLEELETCYTANAVYEYISPTQSIVIFGG